MLLNVMLSTLLKLRPGLSVKHLFHRLIHLYFSHGTHPFPLWKTTFGIALVLMFV